MGNCAEQCPLALPDACKPAAGVLPVKIDLYEYLAIQWRANTPIAEDAVVLPTVPNGFALEAQNAGSTGAEEPAYSPVEGEVFWDGSVQWELIPAGEDGLYEASDPDHDVEPSESGGLDVDGLDVAQGRYLLFDYAAGVRGQRYLATFLVTINAKVRALQQRVTIT